MSYQPTTASGITMDPNAMPVPFFPDPSGRNNQGQQGAPMIPDPSMLMNNFAGMSLGSMPVHNNAAPMPMGSGPGYFVGPDGSVVVLSDNQYRMFNMPPYGGFGNPYLGMPIPSMPFTPGRPSNVQQRTERGHSENPGLDNRRGSYSTTESTPPTPFFNTTHRESGPRVASLDRSAYTTPSPHQIGATTYNADPPAKGVRDGPMGDRALEELLELDPPVPEAVPAVFTPSHQKKTLEQCLENPLPGNRNVYIRGLHPTCDDPLLVKYARRFGAIETSKAIIDTGTGACKGFGFSRFWDVRDSEKCIRALYRRGYEVGFARESFNSRLKAEADDGSTNLYISNLPGNITEMELGALFHGFHIVSAKILRDSMGHSRGVGFARMDSREVCETLIRTMNGVAVGDEGHLMSIRYADTPSQKELKRITAERRQFRTNEYNIGAYGTSLVGVTPTTAHHRPQWRRSPQTSQGQGRAMYEGGSRSIFQQDIRESGDSTLKFMPGQTTASASTSTDAAISTPNSSECDEGVGARTDPAVGIVANDSAPSSPSIKKDVEKDSK